MSYTVRFTDEINKGVITVEDRAVNDDSTSLRFPGRGVTEYGSIVAENLLQMLENFAFSTPPDNPIEGQTWYDTSTDVDQLKIYNGTQWVPASGIFKSTTTPASGAVTGDLWVDTDNQQLYLNTGSGWVLVGPQFSAGSSTGPRAGLLTGTDNQDYAVLIIDVDQVPTVIISGSQFIPKTSIDGFREINPGINLNSQGTPAGFLKYYGLSETAESLRIQNDNIPASNFLRSDVDTTANGIFSVKNNQGVRVGDNNQLSMLANGQRSIIRNNLSGAGLDFQVKRSDSYSTVLRLNSNLGPNQSPQVGINTLNPQETLDITGTLKVSDVVQIDSTEQTGNLNEGALVVRGGTSVAKNLQVGESLTIGDNISVSGNITSTGNSSTISGFDSITATTFIGNVQGNLTGTFNGNATSATSLTNSTTFQMSGDITAVPFSFNGAGNLTKEFVTTLSNGFIANKTATTTSQDDDEILINRTSGSPLGLFRVSKANLVESVPTNPPGAMMPYGGDTAPPGWLLCDGSVVSRSTYSQLFDAIGHKFLDTAILAQQGFSSQLFFGLPDLRGRIPLGRDSMGGTAANRVTSTAADAVGNSGGNETADIEKSNLPAHEHDLRSSDPVARQYYAIRDIPLDTNTDSPEAVSLNIDTVGAASSSVSGIPTSGSITGGGQTGLDDYRTVAGEELGAPLDIMNPYTTVNYIIWTGNV